MCMGEEPGADGVPFLGLSWKEGILQVTKPKSNFRLKLHWGFSGSWSWEESQVVSPGFP